MLALSVGGTKNHGLRELSQTTGHQRAEMKSGIAGGSMATSKQKHAAEKNIKKAAAVARKRRTIAHLPKSTRTALGKQAASVAKKKRTAGQ